MQKNVGGVVTRYVYAGGPAPVAEIDVTANTEKDFIQANGRTWGAMEATKNTYFHHDAIGSVVALSNDNGEVTDTYEYEPFGKVLYHQGTSQNDYQFVGGYGVRSFGGDKQFMGVRQYSEGTGRFTTQDPLGRKAGDENFYRYVKNMVVVFIDPTGEAYFAERKLDRWYSPQVGPLYHIQLFFEDGQMPTNLGYFDDNQVRSDAGNIHPYTQVESGYDDCKMRSAVRTVVFNTAGYNLLTHNCHDWADAVKAEYRRLAN